MQDVQSLKTFESAHSPAAESKQRNASTQLTSQKPKLDVEQNHNLSRS